MIVIKTFDDWDFKENNKFYERMDYATFIKRSNHNIHNIMNGYSRSSQDSGKPDWYGTQTYQEAYDLAINGWKEGISKIKLDYKNNFLLEKIKTDNIYKPTYEVSGNYVDIGRYISGLPDNMVYIKNKPSNKRVKIICKAGFNSGADKESYFKYGLRILSIIDYCEKQNIRVELLCRFCTEYGNCKSIIEVILKKYGDFVDINKLAFSLCNPAFQRRIEFSFCESLSKEICKAFDIGGCYGRTTDLFITEQEELEDICLDSRSLNSFSDEELTNNIDIKINK